MAKTNTKLWNQDTTFEKLVEDFTVGDDRRIDLRLAPFDILGSLAHCIMLHSIQLINTEELSLIRGELEKLYTLAGEGKLSIEEGVEDIHSQIEILLTRKLGEVGEKIHSGRSRNDQVLLDIRLFLRYQIRDIIENLNSSFDILIDLSERFKANLLPGYTHLQLAMPSSFGLWFAAYAESLVDDMIMLQAVYKVINKNPLGSAAGYGTSFPINRRLTTKLLGFDDLNYNVVYAQLGRGKTEKIFSFGLATVAATLSKMAMDICLYLNQNFAFISFPENLSTGSSIMPHKKNPDVFELIRAKCNRIQALPNEITLLCTNLPSGYHRDFQMLKQGIIECSDDLLNSIKILKFMLQRIEVPENILEDKSYENLFSVEEVNHLVASGKTFRQAYREVGRAIKEGTFKAKSQLHHTHEGSMGNLCNDKIRDAMKRELKKFDFDKTDQALQDLWKL